MTMKESTVFARVKVPTQVVQNVCCKKIIFQWQADIEEALLRRKKQELLEMYAIGRFKSLISIELDFQMNWLSDGDDLDKFAAEEAAMDTATAEAAADSSAASKSQAVESLRDVQGEEKPPGDEEDDWLEVYLFKSWRHLQYIEIKTVLKWEGSYEQHWSDVNFDKYVGLSAEKFLKIERRKILH